MQKFKKEDYSMKKIAEIWSDKENRNMLLKCAVVMIYPFLLCCLYCKLRGTSLFELYLPNSYNNDVLFYYKQVEGILAGGIPKGYFGYNESSALYGSFATWNPLLFLPWVLWGLVFGWGYMSVLICNIVLFSISLTLFVCLTKMEWKNIIMLFILLSLFPSFPIHLLQGLPETIVASVLVVYFGFAVKASKEELKLGYIIAMFVSSSFLTICRPFMLILAILPGIYLVKLKEKKVILISILIFGFDCIAYFICNKFFASEYFAPLFKTEFIESLLQGNISLAISLVVPYFKELLGFIWAAFSYGLTAGTQYVIAMLAAAILFVFYLKDKKKYNASNIIYVITVIGIIGATLVIGQKINEGGRHIWAFAIVGIILCSLNKWSVKTIISNGAIACILIFFVVNGAMVPTDYDIPQANQDLQTNIEYWEEVFREQGIESNQNLGWDNTIIYTISSVEHYELYAVPKGMGINCCRANYVTENIKTLKSKYIAVETESELHELCVEEKYKEIGRTENVVIFQRY